MYTWWKQVQQTRFYRLLLVGAVLVVAGTAGLIWQSYSYGRLDTDPAKGTRSELRKLSVTVNKLQSNLSIQDPAKATKNYPAYLHDIQAGCNRINTYYGTWKTSGAEGNADLFNQSHDLCADLAKLASFSAGLYAPLTPLMRTDTTPRRYQTVWPFAGRMRHSNQQAVASALNTLSRTKPAYSDDVDFSSDILPELKQLQQAMKTSTELGYLPALHTFQLQALGERKHFWVEYAGLAQLQQTLENVTQQD